MTLISPLMPIHMYTVWVEKGCHFISTKTLANLSHSKNPFNSGLNGGVSWN